MNRTEQDRPLIERIKKGDRSAFQWLVERYKDDAYAVACSIIKDSQLAEDVLQEVFIKVFDKIKTYKYESAFYTWLYRIVVNRCYNEQRKKKKVSGEWIEVGTDREEAANLVTFNDRRELVNMALSKMKPDEALVLRLFYLSEMSLEEVMQVTDFSKSKVKVSLHRGRKSLMTILKNDLGKEIEDL